METNLKDLGKTVRIIREVKEVTQTQLAELAGLKQSTISFFESDPTGIHISTLARIARALKCDLTFKLKVNNSIPDEAQKLLLDDDQEPTENLPVKD